MKIVILNRSDAQKTPGGDTVQIHAITKFLQRHGYQVVLLDALVPQIPEADLVLLFNLTNPFEAYVHYQTVKAKNIPYVVFPVYWDLDKVIPSSAYPQKLHKVTKLFLPKKAKSILKGIRFYVKNNKQLSKFENVCFKDFLHTDQIITEILDNALLVCPNSEAEREHILQAFPTVDRQKCYVIKNGYEEKYFCQEEDDFFFRVLGKWANSPFICCVGGIGPRKNQLGLVKAMRELDIPLVIVGKASAGCEPYYQAVRKEAGDNVIFTGNLEQARVYQLLSKALVHVQPSYIETPGLASLEAAAQGTQVVVAKTPPVVEYFKEYAIYCDPYSINSIANALKQAIALGRTNKSLQELVRENYQWETVLQPFLKVINSVN